MIEEKKILIEERRVPEQTGLLGSKITYILDDGSIRKEERTPFCDVCHSSLAELALCSSCMKKLCQSCIITYQDRVYCRDCAKAIVSITPNQFMVLFGIANEAGLKDIGNASYMGSEDLRKSLAELLERNLTDKKGLSIFAHYVITDKGISVLDTSKQIYRNEASYFLIKIQEFVEGNAK